MRDDRPMTHRPATADTAFSDEVTAEPYQPSNNPSNRQQPTTITNSSVATVTCPPDPPDDATIQVAHPPATPDETKIAGQEVRHLWFLAVSLGFVLVLAASISLGFVTGLLGATTTLWLIALVAGALTIGLLAFHLWSKRQNFKI